MASKLVLRSRNVEWQVWQTEDGKFDHQQVLQMLLMDIRDALQILNRTFGCPNFVAIPGILRQVEKNTRKPKLARKKVVAK